MLAFWIKNQPMTKKYNILSKNVLFYWRFLFFYVKIGQTNYVAVLLLNLCLKFATKCQQTLRLIELRVFCEPLHFVCVSCG